METEQLSDYNLHVFCRWRPEEQPHSSATRKLAYELKGKNLVEIETNRPCLTLSFNFKRIFGQAASQEEVFEHTTLPIIQKTLEGYNGAVLAYGQTSSGKTYTMQGPDSHGPKRGIISRAAEALFDSEVTSKLSVSILEIYLEKIKDLTINSQNEQNLKIREDPIRGIYVEKASQISISNKQQLLEIIHSAEKNRRTDSTNCNQRSSRSHIIVQINLRRQDEKGTGGLASKLLLVDLAGSENIRRSGVEGKGAVEATSINSSLTYLRKVIQALAAGNAHIPYRESKLTRILQESLGGNSLTSIIVTCSTDYSNLDDTISTLRFGDSSQKIRARVKPNKISDIKSLERELIKLRRQCSLQKETIRDLEGKLNISHREKKVPRLALRSHSLQDIFVGTNTMWTPSEGSIFSQAILDEGFLSDRLVQFPKIESRVEKLNPEAIHNDKKVDNATQSTPQVTRSLSYSVSSQKSFLQCSDAYKSTLDRVGQRINRLSDLLTGFRARTKTQHCILNSVLEENLLN